MNEQEFNEKILCLAFLMGTDGAEEKFADEYEIFLNEVNASPGPRFERLSRLKTLLLLQAGYLLREWLKEVSEPCAGSA